MRPSGCAGCREFARRRESPFGVIAGPRGPGGVHARDARIMSARAECTRLGSFGAGVRTTAFLPPRYTAKTATRVRSSAEHIETPCRSRQNTGRPTGETRACDVATAGVIAGKSGDYTSVDLSRVTNRKLVPGNGQTAMGAYMTWWASVQHCPSAAGRNLGRPHRPRSPAGRDKPARRVLPVPEAHGPPIALTATRRGGRPP